jgi:transcriptional regulator with XRE-family HTH domain
MLEIRDIYDVIDIIRKKNNMSVRQLALSAGIHPSTLVSLLNRRPIKMNKDALIRIADVFDVKWYELINKTESFANNHALDSRVQIILSEEDIDVIKKKFIQLPDHIGYHREAQVKSKTYKAKGTNNDSIMLVMKTLNEDGMLEVMKKIVEVASNPQYRHKGE